MKTRILAILLAMTMLTPMVLMTSCGTKAEPPEGTYTRMTVDINPSVEFMIDDQNKVVSVTALNDDGSILIVMSETRADESADEVLVFKLSGF